MDAGWALILAAFVSAVGTVMVALIQKFRKENQADHNVVMGMLKILYKSHTRMEEKLDNHIREHDQQK
jgi:low affinity Fe/Cu permease